METLQGEWAPEDEHTTADSMGLRTGLRTSSNRAAVKLLQDVGIPRTVAAVKAMGVGGVPSVAGIFRCPRRLMGRNRPSPQRPEYLT